MDFRSLLPLQALDQRLAQLEHRNAQLPERAAAHGAEQELQSATKHIESLRRRQHGISEEIDRLEARGKELSAKKTKYEAQLKSVVVMREVDALQHEISVVEAEHSLLDDAELALIDENENLERSLEQATTRLPTLEAASKAAGQALAAAVGDMESEMADIRAQRSLLADSLDGATLALYESVRSRTSSAAVAELVRGSCGGCHTAVSPKEQAEIASLANTPEARCPYCSCLIVV